MARHFLIDGYNLLYAFPELPPGDWKAKRSELLRWLARHPYAKRNPMTVVFDSRQGEGNQETTGGIDVVFPAGETADDWIITTVREAPNPRIVTVVTDDLGLRHMIRGRGAVWMGAGEFIALARRPEEAPPEQTDEPDDITDEMKRRWLDN